MKIIQAKDYKEMSRLGAEFIARTVRENPRAVLGLATGSTPEGAYAELAGMGLDFSGITTYNLDEYYPIKGSDSQSYRYYMEKNLFSKINIKNTNLPDGGASDAAAECLEYEKKIERSGGIDLQLVGIGANGHIGFNEPGAFLSARTGVVELTESTIDANSRFFASRSEVPRRAISMGMATIMHARKILLLISGESKRDAYNGLISGRITTQNPATMLQMHPDVTVITDLK